MGSHWSDTQLDLLRKHHAEKCSFSQIANLIFAETGASFSKNACIGKARRIGLEKRRERNKGGRPRVVAHRRHRMNRKESLPADTAMLAKFEAIASPDHLGIPFFDLEPGHCRFPQGDGIAATYCGQPKACDSSYCSYHFSIAYRPPEVRQARRAA